MLFKVSLEEEIHVTNFKQTQTFSDLQNFLHHAFKKLPKKYFLAYEDEDGDLIHLMCDEDLKSLFSLNSNKVYIRIKSVKTDDLPALEKENIHEKEEK